MSFPAGGFKVALQAKIIDNVGIIKTRGSLIGDSDTDEVREKVKTMIDSGIRHIVIDLARVRWMNSRGVGMLMACYSTIYPAEGKIALTRIPEKVLSIMRITRVDALFDHFDSIRQAVKNYRRL